MHDDRWPSDIIGCDRRLAGSARHDPHQSFRSRDYYFPLLVADTIGKNWMYKPGDSLKNVDQLRALWQKTVGRGANLVLNVPADRSGCIPDEYVAALTAFKETMERDSDY